MSEAIVGEELVLCEEYATKVSQLQVGYLRIDQGDGAVVALTANQCHQIAQAFPQFFGVGNGEG